MKISLNSLKVYRKLIHLLSTAFDKLLQNLPDLVLDTPDAPTVLGNFIARSVADDTLAPRFLQNYQGKVDCELAK